MIIVSSPSSDILRLMAMEISMELWAYSLLCTTNRFSAGRWLIIRTIAATKMVIIERLGISSLCAFMKSIIGFATLKTLIASSCHRSLSKNVSGTRFQQQ